MQNPNTPISTVFWICAGLWCLWPLAAFGLARALSLRLARRRAKLVHSLPTDENPVHTYTLTVLEHDTDPEPVE